MFNCNILYSTAISSLMRTVVRCYAIGFNFEHTVQIALELFLCTAHCTAIFLALYRCSTIQGDACVWGIAILQIHTRLISQPWVWISNSYHKNRMLSVTSLIGPIGPRMICRFRKQSLPGEGSGSCFHRKA